MRNRKEFQLTSTGLIKSKGEVSKFFRYAPCNVPVLAVVGVHPCRSEEQCRRISNLHFIDIDPAVWEDSPFQLLLPTGVDDISPVTIWYVMSQASVRSVVKNKQPLVSYFQQAQYLLNCFRTLLICRQQLLSNALITLLGSHQVRGIDPEDL